MCVTGYICFLKRANIEYPIRNDNYFLSFKNTENSKIQNPNSKIHFVQESGCCLLCFCPETDKVIQ
jgi:hypothetical protein